MNKSTIFFDKLKHTSFPHPVEFHSVMEYMVQVDANLLSRINGSRDELFMWRACEQRAPRIPSHQREADNRFTL
jgi:hypothetical protein